MSYYKCPVCHESSKESDKSYQEQGHIIRKLVYECGTVFKLIQDGMRYRENIKPSEKCVEDGLIAEVEASNARSTA